MHCRLVNVKLVFITMFSFVSLLMLQLKLTAPREQDTWNMRVT